MVNRNVGNVVLLIIVTLLMGCGNISASKRESKKATITLPKPLFTLPEVPSTIVGAEFRCEYLAQHYWDNFKFDDAAMINSDSLLSVAVGGYVQVLGMNSASVVEESVDKVLNSALKVGYDPFDRLTSKLEDYLYNPNSPMRNEELYLYVLRYTVEKSQLDNIYKIRSRAQLKLVMKNRRGEVALDFEYEDKRGKSSSLHTVNTPYVVLFFNTPDCDDCARVKKYIAKSAQFTELVKAGELTILGVYTEQNMELWRKADYPALITNVADTKGSIAKGRLYDLKALPTLYLLDSDKKVLLKDCAVEQIEQYLNRRGKSNGVR